ncbi:MAG TPA: VOC family protein [Thermoanaerobaculia bacterium]|nr:VOC family protein [Thermoanaerobaculia bacterium]
MSGESNCGRFVWYDLMTPDPEAAKAFYTAVAGWGTQLFESMAYTMWTAGETPVGGIMKLPDEAVSGGAQPHWLAYVSVANVDATTARAQELGGKVLVPPTDIPTVGRYSVITDPQGASIATFTPENAAQEAPAKPPVGDFSWHELATTDAEAAFSFYSELFGWAKTSAMDMGPMGVYQMYGCGEVPFGGMFPKPKEMPGPPAWLHYARVADVNASVEAVKQNGGKVLMGPHEVPGGDLIVQIMDPQGGMFAVHQVKAG